MDTKQLLKKFDQKIYDAAAAYEGMSTHPDKSQRPTKLYYLGPILKEAGQNPDGSGDDTYVAFAELFDRYYNEFKDK